MAPRTGLRQHSSTNLFVRIERAAARRRLSDRTLKLYVGWIRRFVVYHGRRHPDVMGESEVADFLESLANEGRVSSSTQNQAGSALAFLFNEVVGNAIDLKRAGGRPKKPRRLPVILNRGEVHRILSKLPGRKRIVAGLLYGSGLKLLEALSLRIDDVDFELNQLRIRRPRGRDRSTILATQSVTDLAEQIAQIKDRQPAREGTRPESLGRLYIFPGRETVVPGGQNIFPGGQTTRGLSTRHLDRNHIHPSTIQRAIQKAVRAAGILKHANCHALRHSFAAHLLEDGYDIRTVQELLGHRSVRSTLRYTSVLDKTGPGVQSPLDTMDAAVYPPDNPKE